jgi:hypothetical protein
VRRGWQWLRARLPRWLLVSTAVTFVVSLCAGLWLDASGSGAQHGFVVNLVAALAGASLGLPIVSVALPEILQRDNQRRQLPMWAPVIRSAHGSVHQICWAWYFTVLRPLRNSGECLTEPPDRVPNRQTAVELEHWFLTDELAFAAESDVEDVLTGWVNDARATVRELLEELRHVQHFEKLLVQLRHLDIAVLSDKARMRFPPPSGKVTLRKIAPGETKYTEWLRWCRDVTAALCEAIEETARLYRLTDEAGPE